MRARQFGFSLELLPFLMKIQTRVDFQVRLLGIQVGQAGIVDGKIMSCQLYLHNESKFFANEQRNLPFSLKRAAKMMSSHEQLVLVLLHCPHARLSGHLWTFVSWCASGRF